MTTFLKKHYFFKHTHAMIVKSKNQGISQTKALMTVSGFHFCHRNRTHCCDFLTTPLQSLSLTRSSRSVLPSISAVTSQTRACRHLTRALRSRSCCESFVPLSGGSLSQGAQTDGVTANLCFWGNQRILKMQRSLMKIAHSVISWLPLHLIWSRWQFLVFNCD